VIARSSSHPSSSATSACLAHDRRTPRRNSDPTTDVLAGEEFEYKLVNVGSGLLAGVAQSSTANGASVVQWNDVSVDDQLWKIVRVN